MSAHPPSVLEACAWALERLDGDLAAKDLAHHARLRPAVFSRRFSREMGVPPSRWLSLVRLERAKELLERDDLSLADVARTAGFRTTANLRARFRQRTGATPAEYRAAHRHVT